ncbi:matrilysin isoform X2 [Zonotrichia albicollis]|uniref:matrilysin isoform X2 n=1 Tax=Zonotrichia albicollis TaxID=44394 RepID=UPI003D80BE1E
MGTMHYLLLCALIFLPETPAFPLQQRPQPWSTIDLEKVKRYLDKFFPILSKTQNMSIEERIKEMQKFFHLTVTGKLDKETEGIMTMPRCGMPDVAEYQTFPGTPRWKKTHLTYKILSYTQDLPRRKVEDAIRRALMVWSDVTPLQFRKVDTGRADIEIRFARRDINLFLVAAHEFGHSLGLTHSNDPGALMYPYYSYQNPQTFKLPAEDKRRIQKLYGKKPSNS